MTKGHIEQQQAEFALARFIKGMQKRIQKSELFGAMDQNAPLTGRAIAEVLEGWLVYFVVAEDRETEDDVFYLKIGVSSNLPKRLSALKVGCPLEFTEVHYSCTGRKKDAYRTEKAAHESLKGYRCSGEWFRFESTEQFATAAGKLRDAIKDSFGASEHFVPDNAFFYGLEITDDYREIKKFVQMVWLLNDENSKQTDDDIMRAWVASASIQGGEHYWEEKYPEIVGYMG